VIGIENDTFYSVTV